MNERLLELDTIRRGTRKVKDDIRALDRDRLTADQRAREEIRDRERARRRAYYDAHSEQERERARAYYAAHREKRRASIRAYYEAHRDDINFRKLHDYPRRQLLTLGILA